MSDREHRLRKQIIKISRRLYRRGLLSAADGNISQRLDEERLLITPSGVPKAFLEPEDIAVMNLKGQPISGRPSSEKLMHLTVYQKCPDAQAVIHAHPPIAIAWSIAHPTLQRLPAECMSEVILAVGEIPIVPFARPGTQQMGDQLLPFLPQHRAMVLSRHGALSWGESLTEAFCGLERIESSAEILKYAKELGGITPLPTEEIAVLKEMRQKLGERSL